MRGVFEPRGAELELIQHGRRESEIYQFATRVAPCAGEDFELNREVLAQMNQRVEEMDKLEVIELNSATFKYEHGLIDVSGGHVPADEDD